MRGGLMFVLRKVLEYNSNCRIAASAASCALLAEIKPMPYVLIIDEKGAISSSSVFSIWVTLGRTCALSLY